MSYQYKAILLVKEGYDLTKEHVGTLNSYFEAGWEFVKDINQNVSTGSSYTKRTSVVVILRKEIPGIGLS